MREGDPRLGGGRAPAPLAALLAGLGTGALVMVLANAPALLLQCEAREGFEGPVLLYWISPSVAAAMAGGVAALKMDASTGRIAAIALLGFLGAVCVTGVLDYALLLGFLVAPPEESSWMGMLWRRQVLISSLALFVAALRGVMFGRPDTRRTPPERPALR